MTIEIRTILVPLDFSERSPNSNEWAGHLARVVRDVLGSAPGLHDIEHHGSHTGPCMRLAKGCANG